MKSHTEAIVLTTDGRSAAAVSADADDLRCVHCECHIGVLRTAYGDGIAEKTDGDGEVLNDDTEERELLRRGGRASGLHTLAALDRRGRAARGGLVRHRGGGSKDGEGGESEDLGEHCELDALNYWVVFD